MPVKSQVDAVILKMDTGSEVIVHNPLVKYISTTDRNGQPYHYYIITGSSQ